MPYLSVAFPDTLDAGLRVAKIGRSSARCEVGIFRAGEDAVAAQGHFVHVFVDRIPNRADPARLSRDWREEHGARRVAALCDTPLEGLVSRSPPL